MASHSSLSDLPVELLAMIASLLPPKDLLPLRRTCRGLEYATLDVFASVHFSEKAFIFSDPRSMQALVSIANHAVFSRQLKRLELSFVELATAAKARTIRQSEVTHIRTGRALRGSVEADYATTLCRQREFDRFKRTAILAEALRNLQASGRQPAIIALGSDADDKSLLPCGYWSMVSAVGDPGLIEIPDYNETAFCNIYRGISLANFPVSKLQLGSWHRGAPLDMFRYSGIAPSFLQLTDLKLTIALGDVSDVHPVPHRLMKGRSMFHPPGLDAFASFVLSAPNIRNLSLAIDQVDYGLHGTTFLELADEEDFTLLPDLRELHLAGFLLTPRHILDFVVSRKSKIRKIHLQQVRDKWLVHDGIDEHLRQILGDHADVDVKIEDSWNGRWLPSWAAEAGLV
ncbi:hypothetical protein LTR56_008735 [Elasticomyces elasticus]|nr:hypothetical protein LTR22_017520 [Elasticomyces elasticus]KAK3646117.1 hypothetical protein LTR56_008735 [Elasticomyces elasticus]KAK4924298.1 hypothetical protein LTR49_008599 [Elasticomyces elasticus]KAK5759144.1 hypothetical protein LTS12_010752 [Elasticomyces elasticus]